MNMDKKNQHTATDSPEAEPLMRRFANRRNLRKPLWKAKVSDLARLDESDDRTGYDPYNRPPQQDSDG